MTQRQADLEQKMHDQDLEAQEAQRETEIARDETERATLRADLMQKEVDSLKVHHV